MKDYFEDIKKEIDLKLLPLVDYGLEINTTYKTKQFFEEKKRLETIKKVVDIVLKSKIDLINAYTKELSKIMFNVFANFIIVTGSYESILKEVFSNEYVKKEIYTDKEIEKFVIGYSTKQFINAVISPSSCVSFSSYGPSTTIDHFNKKVYEKIKIYEYQMISKNQDESDEDVLLSNINGVQKKKDLVIFSNVDEQIHFEYGLTDDIKLSKSIIDNDFNGFKPDYFYIAGISNDFTTYGVYAEYNDYAFTPVLKYIFEYMSSSSTSTLSKQFMQL